MCWLQDHMLVHQILERHIQINPKSINHILNIEECTSIISVFTTDPKTPTPWWAQNNGAGVFSLGVSEATPLHVSCHLVSDGTKLETAGYRHHAAVVSTLPGAAPTAQPTVEPQQVSIHSCDSRTSEYCDRIVN